MDKSRIAEIDQRIKDLEEHAHMWARAGGVGGNMAMNALAEISDLRMEKDDILNGTNNLALRRRKRELQSELIKLKKARDEAIFFKNLRYGKAIREKEAELDSLHDQSNKVLIHKKEK